MAYPPIRRKKKNRAKPPAKTIRIAKFATNQQPNKAETRKIQKQESGYFLSEFVSRFVLRIFCS
jgi:hypothetical protein